MNKERMNIGIPDSAFVRGSLPMTKSEIRAMIMSRMALARHEIVYDIGSGTGSVSVEMALAVPDGRVFAIERNEEGEALLRQNAENFGVSNVEFILGTAPAALSALPAPDAAFIGGSSGNLREIFGILTEKNPKVRIVMTAVTLETVAEGVALMDKYQMEMELLQLSVARAKKIGSRHMMLAQNPIYLISGN